MCWQCLDRATKRPVYRRCPQLKALTVTLVIKMKKITERKRKIEKQKTEKRRAFATDIEK